jgi:hypothetical protein
MLRSPGGPGLEPVQDKFRRRGSSLIRAVPRAGPFGTEPDRRTRQAATRSAPRPGRPVRRRCALRRYPRRVGFGGSLVQFTLLVGGRACVDDLAGVRRGGSRPGAAVAGRERGHRGTGPGSVCRSRSPLSLIRTWKPVGQRPSPRPVEPWSAVGSPDGRARPPPRARGHPGAHAGRPDRRARPVRGCRLLAERRPAGPGGHGPRMAAQSLHDQPGIRRQGVVGPAPPPGAGRSARWSRRPAPRGQHSDHGQAGGSGTTASS